MKVDEIGKINSYMVQNTLNVDKKENKKIQNTTPLKPISQDVLGTTPLKPLGQDVFIKTNESLSTRKEKN